MITPKVRAVLDQIEDLLIAGNSAPVNAEAEEDAANLWVVLTALRGPDDGNQANKEATTIPIRCAAFPRLLAKLEAEEQWYAAGAEFRVTDRKGNPVGAPFNAQHAHGHFAQHASAAAKTLDLIEDKE